LVQLRLQMKSMLIFLRLRLELLRRTRCRILLKIFIHGTDSVLQHAFGSILKIVIFEIFTHVDVVIFSTADWTCGQAWWSRGGRH